MSEVVGKYTGKNPLEKLHDGEPYFFLRAQDRLAPDAVRLPPPLTLAEKWVASLW